MTLTQHLWNHTLAKKNREKDETTTTLTRTYMQNPQTHAQNERKSNEDREWESYAWVWMCEWVFKYVMLLFGVEPVQNKIYKIKKKKNEPKRIILIISRKNVVNFRISLCRCRRSGDDKPMWQKIWREERILWNKVKKKKNIKCKTHTRHIKVLRKRTERRSVCERVREREKKERTTHTHTNRETWREINRQIDWWTEQIFHIIFVCVLILHTWIQLTEWMKIYTFSYDIVPTHTYIIGSILFECTRALIIIHTYLYDIYT